jgi:hypothetical protein
VDVGWSCVHNDVENLLFLDLPSLQSCGIRKKFA